MNAFSAALSSIRRSPYQALAAIMIATVTFGIIFLLSSFLAASQLVLRHYETRPEIIAFFEIEASDADITATKKLMDEKPYVANTNVTTKEQALQIYSDEYKDSPMLLELVSADILPASIEVSATSIDALTQVKQDLESAPGIEEVDYQEIVIDKLKSWTTTARTVGIATALIFLLLSFLVIMVIVGMRVSMQKPKIAVMRLIGATKWYVERPFMVEGMIYGAVGATIGWLIAFAIVLGLSPDVQAFVSEVQLFPIPWQFAAAQFTIGFIGATFLGALAGLAASQRLIRQ